jgi:hypothetical protein
MTLVNLQTKFIVDKLSITNEMTCFDRKDRKFYESLTDEEKKKFSNYLMIRWGSAVQGSQDLQEFYLISCNERLNKHFFAVNKHPKLQWLMATTVSPGMGTHRHQWIAPKKKDSNGSGIKKQLSELFPNMKPDEIELMSEINTKKDLENYLKELGQEIKK